MNELFEALDTRDGLKISLGLNGLALAWLLYHRYIINRHAHSGDNLDERVSILESKKKAIEMKMTIELEPKEVCEILKEWIEKKHGVKVATVHLIDEDNEGTEAWAKAEVSPTCQTLAPQLNG